MNQAIRQTTSLPADVRLRPSGRHRALAWLLLFVTLAPAVLLLVALRENGVAEGQFTDVNRSGSLRYRSLWVYGRGQAGGAAEVARMAQIREDLRRRYPDAVARTDPAWGAFRAEFDRTGRVGWGTADRMRIAADAMTQGIQARAHAGSLHASELLDVGLIGMALTLLGITTLMRNLWQSEQRLAHVAAILDASPDLIGMSDAHGKLIYLNQAFRRFLGLGGRDDPALASIAAFHAPWSYAKVLGEARPAALRDGSWQGETAFLAPSGAEVPMSQVIMAHRAVDGALESLSSIARPITEQKQTLRDLEAALADLRDSQRLFLASVNAMQEGLIVQDRDGTILRYNASAARILGLSSEDLVGRTFSRPGWRFVREDGTDFPEEEHPQRTALRTGHAPPEVTLGLEKRPGLVQWLRIKAAPLFHAGEELPHAVVVTFTDVTEQKTSGDALRESQRFAESIAEHSTSIIFVFDLQTLSNTYSNRTVAEFLGYSTEKVQALGDGLLPFMIHPDDLPGLRAHLADFAGRADGEVVEFEYRARHASGEWRWIWNRETVFKRLPDGAPSQILGTAQDVTERKATEQRFQDYAVVLEFQKQELEKANGQLEALATLDGLTGIKNHRAFQERLEEETSRAGRYGSPLSLLMLDVDHFKQYNDAFGHPAGDEVLKEVAGLMRECSRDTDVVARYGGEEFAVILPQTDPQGAAVIAERIRQAIEKAPWAGRAVTASLGVATLDPAWTGGELIAAADRALYQSKTSGRNRVSVFRLPCATLEQHSGVGEQNDD